MKQFQAKKLMVVAAALASVAALGSLSLPRTSEAATASTPFDVNITLTSNCTFTNIVAVDFAYTSLGAAANSTGGTLDVTCPLNLIYSAGLVASGSAAAPAANINVTDAQVNLSYTLNAPAGGPGTGAAQAKTISGTMGAGQAGTCAAASCTNAGSGNRTHTLVLTF